MFYSFCYQFDNDDSSLFLYLIYTEDIIERYLIKSVNISGGKAGRVGKAEKAGTGVMGAKIKNKKSKEKSYSFSLPNEKKSSYLRC